MSSSCTFVVYFIPPGAFVLPFMLMLVITGIPLFFLESSFGQYASSGVISIWKASPIFTGMTLHFAKLL